MLHFRPPVSLCLVVMGVGLSLATASVRAQTFVLDPMSASLPGIPATSADFLGAGGLIPTGAPPVVAFSNATLGLLPGDVIDAISFGNDGPVAGSTLTFSVTRAAAGVGGPFTPNVFTEVAGVPLGTQPEAAGDLFTTLDPSCGVVPPFSTQIVDGNGMALAPFTCYPGAGMGLAEFLASPGPPLNDDLTAFDWSLPGTWYFAGGVGFSLAAGSPTLTPGTNPALPAGAEPGDILVAFPTFPPFPPILAVFTPVASLGLISGGPGCAPPACDDVDALSLSFPGGGTHLFSITPASPSIGACAYTPGDVLGAAVAPPLPACLPPLLPAGAIGLAPGDDIDALESFVNACPILPAADLPADGDGIAGGCDNCPAVFNPSQDDADFDGAGDVCDPCTDGDGDGFGNPGFPSVCPLDLCPFTPGPNVDTDGDGLADECDNCPGIANPGQQNTDFDADGDACDPCPHVFAALPSPMTGLRKMLAIYGGNGPGSGDDRPKVIKAEFTTGVAFDPDATDDVHVTLRDAGTGATMFAVDLTAASGLWSQPNPAKLLWKFDDAATSVGVRKALLKERPPASLAYQFKMIGKNADISGPLVGPGMTAVLEINPAGLCFSQTNVVCTSTAAKDLCQ